MHSVQVGMWDPRLQSKHASSLPHPPLSNLRPTRVTTATPAKRITFYKSGDSQFGGIRMAIHKRSFKCFDALLDDLSQKVPLPFGVRTVTTPRGTNTIRHLEQLQDGGCYLCSDRRHTKPINIELASKRPSIWYHHSRRPHRPETSSPPSHVLYRQRRILLIKNTEPGMRRSIVLNRRSTRSLRAFLDEVSEVMQFHVRKLYTAEGRRIDNVQSLLTCPGVLVCAGREAFSPMLVNFIKKSSEEKLPGLGPRTPGNGARSPATQTTRSPPHGAQSRASEYSEGHESKKNVNFGLETKKSIIHPRSDSSNRSTRFSLSSEKSYGNGVSAYSQGRPAIMNDDIEKRVLVNKDGSLSVEMRVRFRLQNDETVQWSTQVKKSPSLTTDCSPLSQVQAHYLQQGQSESCSDPDYVSFEPEGMDYSRQPLERALEVSQCPCCYQRPEQQYDLWENPAHSHKQPIAPPPHPHKSSRTTTLVRHTHSSSSSSSCNSRRVVRCRAQLSGCGRGSGSEHGQLVQEQMCVTEQVERRVEVERDGDTHVEVCRVSRCCSRSEVVAIDTNLRPLSGRSAEEELMAEEERPLSAVSSSSRVLQSLKEDQDDEDHDLPPSASQCCHSKEPSPSPAFQTQLMDNPSSNISAGFVDSVGERGSRALSAASSCHCGTVTPYSKAEAEELDQVPISRSRMRRTSCRSNKTKTPDSEEEGAADDEDEEINRVVSSLSGHTGFSVCPNCGGCKRTASERSHCSHQDSSKPASPLQPDKSTQGSNDDGSDDSAMSTQSNKTNLTNNGRFSAISNVLEERPSSTVSRTSNSEQEAKEEERAPSATSTTSHRSNISHKSGCNCATDVTADKEEERSPTAMSAQSNFSSKSRKSRKSDCSGPAQAPDIKTREEAEGGNVSERAISSLSAKSDVSAKTGTSTKSHKSNYPLAGEDTNKRACNSLSFKSNASVKSGNSGRPDSAQSAQSTKSSVRTKSSTSHRSTCSHCIKTVAPGANTADEPIKGAEEEEGAVGEERAASVMSAKSNLSVKSNKSHKSPKASERSLSPRSEAGGDGEDRPASQTSARSVKSSISNKSNCNGKELVESKEVEKEENEIDEVKEQQRPQSKISVKSGKEERTATSRSLRSHKSNSNTGEENTGKNENPIEQVSSNSFGKSASPEKSPDTKTDVDGMMEPTTSSKSVKSHTSSKKSTFPNRDEQQNESQERVDSVMSVKSKSSVRTGASHKSNSSKNLKSVMPGENAVTINTPQVMDGEANEAERPPSTASGKSGKSNASSNHKGSADVAAIETDTEVKIMENNAPINKSDQHSLGQMLSPKRTQSRRAQSPKAPAATPNSPQPSVQQLLPGVDAGETRGPNALSVKSVASAKSGRSKCHCGEGSAAEKGRKEKEVEDQETEKKEDNEDIKSEGAINILSSSSKRQRKESGDTEQPLSRQSSGSVSLGLPEDLETADSDSGKSSVSFYTNAGSKHGQTKTATPDVRKTPVEEARSTVSQKSNKSGNKGALAHNLPAVDIPTIKTHGSESKDEGKKTERAASATSNKSSRSNKSCKCREKAAAHMPNSRPKEQTNCASSAGNDLETDSVKSASKTNTKELDASDNRPSSATSSASAKVRSKSSASASMMNANAAETPFGDSPNNNIENENASRPASKAKEKDKASDRTASSLSKSSCCLRPESAASAQSATKNKAAKQSEAEDSVKSEYLKPVKGQRAKSDAGSESGNIKTSTCQKKKRHTETCSESTLSHSLSAADLLKEALAPHSRQSKPSKTSGKMSEKNANSQNDQEDELEPTPACLPNASPNEVVSDWLRSIPANSSMLALGDELMDYEQEKEVEEKAGEEVAKEEEVDERLGHEDKTEAEDNVDKDGEAECDAAEKSPDPTPGNAVGLCSRPNPLFSNSESLPRNWHSSVAVMKVLLTSSLGRCRSMPEVSPVYGRRLSTSARGLLDCLAQLQLIEPAVSPGFEQQKDRNQQYEDIMAILQSLWLTEPRDFEATKIKDNGIQQVTPPRSSSGVDMSSGSGGSGKENGNQGRHESLQKKTEYSHDDEEAVKVVGENVERNVEEGEKENEAEPQDLHIEQAVTDTADEQDQSTILPSLDSPKASDNPSSSDKSSANDSSKSPTDNEQETVEDSSSGTPPTILRASFSKKLSQDPDPVWVLNLLKKLEKQFINHYINAMAEFKVRWELDDSLILDTMISELRDEVSRRIQSSIEREMRKIQGRAGRGGRSPRPPQGMNLSRDSTMTEKRRQLLKVMKNQSVKTADSLSDGELTGEFSDQRSDDEYCPCDTCVRKKMAARPLKANPIAAEAPVMMEFDLLKILQLKKNPLPTPAAVTQSKEEKIEMVVVDEEGRNLEVVHEEEEEDETKEDIKAQIVLEETIPEEDEEDIEEDADEYGEEREAGEQRTSDEENEAASVNGEEEEEESECQCQCARNEDSDSSNEGEEAEETSDYTGEDEKGDDKSETGSGKEESDRETVKEATAGEEETTENEEEEGGCEVCDFKPEEVADSESGENEETNDDNAAENAVNQESTLVEEFADGNISASAEAENEDDTDDGAGEGESHESHEDEKGGESEQQEGLSSEEERDSPPDQEVTPAAEGEEADAEDSDISNKRPSDNSAEESGHERPGSAGGEEGGDDKEDRVVEDAVEELKPDEEDEVVNSKKKEVDVLLHQFTKTSVESQPGSLEEVNMSSHLNPVSTIEGSKTVVSTGGGATQRRSRSPARVKRCKPKEKDIELDNL